MVWISLLWSSLALADEESLKAEISALREAIGAFKEQITGFEGQISELEAAVAKKHEALTARQFQVDHLTLVVERKSELIVSLETSLKSEQTYNTYLEERLRKKGMKPWQTVTFAVVGGVFGGYVLHDALPAAGAN